ncbi:helix-turn-helix family protein [Bordetella holmesii 30539]|uniref:Helix-turn-helix family protein n=1 Tax=Bordetella holmesii 1058 TaxID=1247648 RepID=A0ABP3BJG2_9BORD|nr:helix-turn-helix family protein [Bordetella holmesii ATCC 51541]EWM41202.1 helix-turn-helix family protein [Bordetella holmesii 35009]EWM44254.1 helix-turn-helix family protein [Bordetella holmesii 41130]EXF88408.1 helix-turn-helix family protein [Bordetella holmesii 30539]EXX94409.1 helix-turn-helix family protein [Bordetella holmesii 1058]
MDELARRSQVSRATLSRLENAEVSPTTQVLGRLCATFEITLSRLLRMVEEEFPAFVPLSAQAVWRDTGFVRRSVSPPARNLAGEVLACELVAGTCINYDAPPRPGLEHHLVLVQGDLEMTVDGRLHHLAPGDCLRYQLYGASRFLTQTGAHYFLFLL